MRPLIATALGLILLTPLAAADECERELLVGSDATGFYSVDNDLCQPDCIFSVWIYYDDDPYPCEADDEATTVIF